VAVWRRHIPCDAPQGVIASAGHGAIARVVKIYSADFGRPNDYYIGTIGGRVVAGAYTQEKCKEYTEQSGRYSRYFRKP
jgi:hypothetical protein